MPRLDTRIDIFYDDEHPLRHQQRWAEMFADLAADVQSGGVRSGRTWFWRRVCRWLRAAEPDAYHHDADVDCRSCGQPNPLTSHFDGRGRCRIEDC